MTPRIGLQMNERDRIREGCDSCSVVGFEKESVRSGQLSSYKSASAISLIITVAQRRASKGSWSLYV